MTEQSPAEAVFFEALKCGTAAERVAYLDAACAGQPALRARVEKLLAAHPRVGDFLAEPHPAADGTRSFADDDPDGTRDRPAPIEEAGQLVAGRYKLVERIGEGGMGSVWMAEQTEPVKRKVAVKLIKAGLDSKQVLARFEAERQALALMDHPNISKVFDGGIHDGRPYFVMELVKGVPITEFCDARKLTPQQRLELFVPVCQAIQHAHQKGVIHRDIKPANVLVALYDDRPVPKVIDFGVAKATGPTLTEHTLNTGFGGIVGTPQYMSPEQATFNNLDIDTRSDVYSLGVLLYELLAGSPPFHVRELERRGLLEILRVVREVEPPKPSIKLSTADALPSLSASRGMEPKQLTGLLRSELDWIVMKALEKDRTRRYETANGFAADVQRYLSGEPVQAHPPTAAYRLLKFVRKNRGPVVAGQAVLLTLFAGLLATTFAYQQAVEERTRANSAEKSATDNALAAMNSAGREAEQRRLVEYRAAMVSVDAALESAKPSTPEGLVRLAGTLKILPPDAAALRQGVVTNLLAWGQEIAPAYTRPGGLIHAVSPDGRVGLITRNGPSKSWEARDLITGERLAMLGQEGTAKTDPYYEDRGGWVAFSGDGKFAATLHEPNASGDPTVRVWDAATWRERFSLRLEEGLYEARLNGDGTRLATRSAVPNPKPADESDDRLFRVRLWDARTGDPVATLDHGGRPVDHVRFSPDGRVLLSASESVVRLWSAADGRLLHTVGPHADAVTLTAFSPSGRTVAVAAGRRVAWWTVADGSPAGPPQELGFSLHPGDPDAFHRFAFETEDVLIVRAWNVHGVSFGRRVGGAVCIRGEMKAHTLDAVCSDGKYALTDDRHVYSLSPFRRLETPPGRKFPAEARASANGRRYVQVGPDLVDLVAEVPIGPRLPQADTGVIVVRATGFGFVIKEMGQYYWNSRLTLIPAHTVLPPDDVLELWAKVLARGHIDPDSGLFKRDDEATWEQNQRELARRADPAGEFPFPGPAARDPTYWLRQAYQETKEAAERLSLAERLVAAKPSWQNHLLRANAYADIGRNVEAIREDLRVQELAKDEYKDATEEGRMALGAARAILSESDLPKADYELALRWFRKTTDEVPDIALALYRLDRPAEALKELATLELPRPTDLVAGLASPWVAAVLSHAHARSLDRHWTTESTLPYVIESLCHSKLGNIASRDWCLTTARKLIRSRDGMKDPLSPRNMDWYGPLVNEALRAERPKEK